MNRLKAAKGIYYVFNNSLKLKEKEKLLEKRKETEEWGEQIRENSLKKTCSAALRDDSTPIKHLSPIDLEIENAKEQHQLELMEQKMRWEEDRKWRIEKEERRRLDRELDREERERDRKAREKEMDRLFQMQMTGIQATMKILEALLKKNN
jgi:hypothetical protein